ncbi:MAG: HD domain-containing phosphohydrolase [Peptococcaceae bacterium]|jgi:PAS domain S-box-containing protein|nr:HD domain-containing protein [Peptococcaceae bacterium]MDH7526329.1 HD domain-containing phosphohydrolase [Peptococcaceae bacterium]
MKRLAFLIMAIIFIYLSTVYNKRFDLTGLIAVRWFYLLCLLLIIYIVFDYFYEKNHVREKDVLLKNLFSNVPCFLVAVSPRFDILMINEKAGRLVGAKPSKLIGKKCYEVFGSEYICSDCLVKKTFQTREIHKGNKKISVSKEMELYVEQTAIPIFDNKGSIKYALEITLDMTMKMELEKEKHDTYLQTVISMSKLIESRDNYTGSHSMRVCNIATTIGRKMNLSSEVIRDISISAILHDIGKIGIPEAILQKPGKLSDDEFEIIKMHPVIGYNALKNIKFLSNVAEYILYHHERYDGKGYPYGKQGNEIPLASRILCVADVYEALISERVYRQAVTHKEAIDIIYKEKGKMFDPLIVDVFVGIIKDNQKAIEETATESIFLDVEIRS